MAGLPGRFTAVWNVDFEYRQPDDNSERPWPLCMVAREFYTRQELRLWRDDLLTLRAAPFDTGEHSLVVAYAVAAEASCFLALDWPLPANVLDLYAEHLLDINGLGLPREAYTLIGAMARHRLPVMSATHKEAMRGKIIDQDHWSPDDVAEILAYCADDVDAGERLLQAMAAKGLIDWERATLARRLHGSNGPYLAQRHSGRRRPVSAAGGALAAHEAHADRASGRAIWRLCRGQLQPQAVRGLPGAERHSLAAAAERAVAARATGLQVAGGSLSGTGAAS